MFWRSKGRVVCFLLAILLTATVVKSIDVLVYQIKYKLAGEELEERLREGEICGCGFLSMMDVEIQGLPELTDDQWEAHFSDVEVTVLPSSYDLNSPDKSFMLMMDVRSADGILSNEDGFYLENVDFRFSDDRSEFIAYYKGYLFQCTSAQVAELIAGVDWQA